MVAMIQGRAYRVILLEGRLYLNGQECGSLVDHDDHTIEVVLGVSHCETVGRVLAALSGAQADCGCCHHQQQAGE